MIISSFIIFVLLFYTVKIVKNCFYIVKIIYRKILLDMTMSQFFNFILERFIQAWKIDFLIAKSGVFPSSKFK